MINYSLITELWEDLDEKERKTIGIVLFIAVVAVISISFLYIRLASLEKKRVALEKTVVEMIPLKKSYDAARLSSDLLSGKAASVRADDTIAKVLDEIGIKGKGIRISNVKSGRQGAFLEESAEVQIDGITVNEMVNLLYRLEKGTRPVTLTKALVKTRYEDQSRIDLSINMAMLKASNEPAK